MHAAPTNALTIDSPYHRDDSVDIVVFPMMLDLDHSIAAGLVTGAQYGRPEPYGAFTGDVSMHELQAKGCTHVLCGHSERRLHHHETDEQIAKQVFAALSLGLTPVLCIGENAEQRNMQETNDVLAGQLVNVAHASGLIIAYEPVWAIGTGKTPSPSEVAETHAFIRSLLTDKHARIIYGGSVTANNAASFFAEEEIDGALVGGASLEPKVFQKIVEAGKIRP